MESSPQLLPVASIIPPHLRSVFPFQDFNEIQTILAREVLFTDENITVCAPTSCGKTVIHELAIVRLIMMSQQQRDDQGAKSFKCVLIAPSKALCQQRASEWRKKFEHTLGFKVVEVTGDTDLTEGIQSIARASIILTTPEKW